MPKPVESSCQHHSTRARGAFHLWRARKRALAAGLTALLATGAVIAQADPDPAAEAKDENNCITNSGRPTELGVCTQLAQTTAAAVDGCRLATSSPCDTEYTPSAKETGLWRQVAGAPFGGTAPATSPTPDDVDFYAVRFIDPRHGLAAGARCQEPASPELDAAARQAYLRDCRRTPVVYAYGLDANGEAGWTADDLGQGSDDPGYVGAVAWIGDGRALAVGGDGCYPRREEPCPGAAGSPTGDPAGHARAWLFEHERWHEVEVPDSADGMTALAFDPTQVEGHELGFAGSYASLWRWQDGSFDREYSASSPAQDVNPTTASAFRFRVRDVLFTSDGYAQAITAGCCDPEPSSHGTSDPAVVVYDPTAKRWTVAVARRDAQYPFGIDSGAAAAAGAHPAGAPDSMYAISGASRGQTAVVMAPGGSTAVGGTEPTSIVCDHLTGKLNCPLITYSAKSRTSRVRLVSLAQPPLPSAPTWTWAVGSLPGGEGAAVANRSAVTTFGVSGTESGYGAPEYGSPNPQADLGCTVPPPLGFLSDPTFLANPRVPDRTPPPSCNSDVNQGVANVQQDHARSMSSSLYRLGSYALSSVTYDTAGTGWAVGDRGAIVTSATRASPAGVKTLADEPPAAQVGPKTAAAPADLAAFDAFGSIRLPVAPGTVPPLESQPFERLPEPRLTPMGSPNAHDYVQADEPSLIEDVQQVVMSRDGTEGWAVGPDVADTTGAAAGFSDTGAAVGGHDRAVASLFHYDGRRWTRCDPTGVHDQIAPDPACAGLSDLRGFRDSMNTFRTVRLTAAARVPFENDGDPSNDDDFEVVAVGTHAPVAGQSFLSPAILRYRGGRWIAEPVDVRPVARSQETDYILRSVAFDAPDDGWILARDKVGNDQNFLLHWNGREWRKCVGADLCDDADGLTDFKFRAGGDETHVDTIVGLLSAGSRVYLYGKRHEGATDYPVVLAHEAGGEWTADPSSGGLDPGNAVRRGADPSKALQGTVRALAVLRRPDHRYEGWAVGAFGGIQATNSYGNLPATVVLRLTGDEAGWSPYSDAGPVHDYLYGDSGPHLDGEDVPALWQTTATRMAMVATPEGEAHAFIAQNRTGRILAFQGERWRVLAAERPQGRGGPRRSSSPGVGDVPVQALAPDGRGGVWVATRTGPVTSWVTPAQSAGLAVPQGEVYFYRYSDRVRQPVFSEAPHPAGAAGEGFTALAGGADGTVWAGTTSGAVYRYDRRTGWDRAPIPGWQSGRVVTRVAQIKGIAIGPDGTGLAVGEQGRVVDLSPAGVRLNAVAGRACDADTPPPCGTGRDLLAAAVAPDGSAFAGGQETTLLWRPAGQELRRLPIPDLNYVGLVGRDSRGGPRHPDVTGIAMPRPDQVWLATDAGLIVAGHLDASGWSWSAENLTAAGKPLALDYEHRLSALRGISVDAAGNGLAVGDDGLVLERTASGWRRVDTGLRDDFTTVTLSPDGDEGALVGGQNGIILTRRAGRFEVARPGDPFLVTYGHLTGRVVGLALAGGSRPGDIEAWAALAGPDPTSPHNRQNGIDQLLHYATAGDPLLQPAQQRALPLPDTPDPRPGELSFAAFGHNNCSPRGGQLCPALEGTTYINSVIVGHVVEAIAREARRAGGPSLSVFSGDAVEWAGAPGSSTRDETLGAGSLLFAGPLELRRWKDFVAGPLNAAGVPLYGAIGGRDLSGESVCLLPTEFEAPTSGCTLSDHRRKKGDNLAWRQALADSAAPWGVGPSAGGDGLSFESVGGEVVELRSQRIEPGTAVAGAPSTTVPLGGAHTHYAFDVKREGKLAARFVFVDTSLGSLSASDPVQNPPEPGGQTAWLEKVLSTRPAGTPAVVVSSTPAYSYGPGMTTDTQVPSDAAAFEAILMRQKVTAVVSGRLGWNGLYWTLAPGVHDPCAGGPYQPTAPSSVRVCGSSASDASEAGPSGPAARGAAAVGTLAAPAGPGGAAAGAPSLTGVVPTILAASAGSSFGPDGEDSGPAGAGFWHGYTIVRLDASGDPAKTIVDQRPVFDWISLSARDHTLRPGQKMTLQGFGREPAGQSDQYEDFPAYQHLIARYDRIDSPAITHRYDLLEADPQKPWLPRVDPLLADDPGHPHGYVRLDPSVATVDQSGQVIAQRGARGRVHAIAVLSVGDKAATWPLVFEPSRSYVPPRVPRLSVPVTPPPKVLGISAASVQPPAPPPPAAGTPPINATIELPAPPALPGFPAGSPLSLPPPVPPAPPAPPGSQHALPVNLTIQPIGVAVPPTTGVTAQPTPPVNPSPPSGARREAKQRQAATAKSEEGSSQAAETQGLGGDPANGRLGPEGAAMTRRDRVRAEAGSLTPLPRRPQASAWVTGLEWTGGTLLMALVLAFGWITARPTPRRRPGPDIRAAPAWAPSRHR